jgi:hypothetical protein
MFRRLQLYFLNAPKLKLTHWPKLRADTTIFQIILEDMETLLRVDRDGLVGRDHSFRNHEQLSKKFE